MPCSLNFVLFFLSCSLQNQIQTPHKSKKRYSLTSGASVPFLSLVPNALLTRNGPWIIFPLPVAAPDLIS